MNNYYRNDGWVKTTLGPAVPGAQIYVCLQPANVFPPITPPNTLPVPWVGPSPQASIFSDNGITPIVQPIITDGFGHYDFYALPGQYTIVVMYGGKVQQYYVDQSVGNAGSVSTSPLVLSTNGTPNFNQTNLNFNQGANILLATDNFGNMTITGSTIPLVLKTNGATNGSQALLNLVDGTGVHVTQDGSGNVTVTNTAPSTGLSPVGSNLVLIGQFNAAYAWHHQPDDCLVFCIPAASQTAFGTKIKVTGVMGTVGAASLSCACSIRRTLPGDVTFTDTTPLTFSGTSTITFSDGQTYTSDAVSVPVDGTHDIYIVFLESSAGVVGTPVYNIFGESAIVRFSGEQISGVDYSTVAAIPSLNNLWSGLSQQSAFLSSITVS